MPATVVRDSFTRCLFDMNVQVKSGVVTFTGTAPSRSAKRCVEDIAHQFGGVVDVVNERVTPSAAST